MNRFEIDGYLVSDRDIERFEDKYEVTSGCWLWIASLDAKGYARFGFHGRNWKAARFQWLIVYEEFPKQHVLHKCDNRACVNPSHLFVGSDKDNSDDKILKGRFVSHNKLKTECIHGHPFDEDNTYFYRERRYCYSCMLDRNSRRRKSN